MNNIKGIGETMLSKREERINLRLQLAQAKEYLDITDVSLVSGFSASLIRQRVKQGKLIAIQNVKGGKLLFKRESVNIWFSGGY